MELVVSQFVDSIFSYEGKQHKVKSASVVNNRLVVKTDRQTFVKLESEIDDFLDKIDFRELSKLEEKESWLPSNDVAKKEYVHQAEIVKSNDLSSRITQKLEAVFDEISSNPSEEMYKKASAMVSASNAIVNVQLANYKYLTLK